MRVFVKSEMLLFNNKLFQLGKHENIVDLILNNVYVSHSFI